MTQPSTTLLGYRRVVAPPKRQLKPGAAKALARVHAAQKKLRAAEARLTAARDAAVRERAEAIESALAQGFTLRSLGQEMGGVSAQRVQQMRTIKESK